MQEGASASVQHRLLGEAEEQTSFRPLKRGRVEQQASGPLELDWRPAPSEPRSSIDTPRQHEQVSSLARSNERLV